MGCTLRLNINYPEFRRYHHTLVTRSDASDHLMRQITSRVAAPGTNRTPETNNVYLSVIIILAIITWTQYVFRSEIMEKGNAFLRF